SKVEAGDDLTDEELDHLKYVVDSITQIDTATAAAEEAKEARNQSIADLIRAGDGEDDESDKDGDTDDDEEGSEENSEAAADVIAEAEKATEEAAKEGVAASGARKPGKQLARTSFKGLAKGKTPAVPKSEIGWQMDPQAHGYKPGLVSFSDLAAAVES